MSVPIRSIALAVLSLAASTPSLATWSTDPAVDNVVTAATQDQRKIHTIPDGTGGAYVAWEDYRGSVYRTYVQRLSADGDAMWTPDGVLAGDGGANQFDPRIASDGAGGVICVWGDSRVASGAVYGQRFDAAGNKLWVADGLEICEELRQQYRPRILTDPAGGAFIAWNDTRRYNQEDIYGQRVDLDGNRLWAAEGRALFTTSGAERNVRLASDGAGGVILVVNDLAIGSVLARRIDAAGVDQWGYVTISTTGTNYPNVEIVADGQGGVIVTWSSTWLDLKAQRLDASGATLWNGGADLEVGPVTNAKFGQVVAADGSGGAYVGYADTRAGSWVIALSHVSGAGAQGWGGGVVVGPRLPSIGPGVRVNGAGEAVITWPSLNAVFMAQTYDAAGVEQWTPGGEVVSTSSLSAYVAPQICETTDDASIIVFERPISATNVDVHAKKILSDGTLGDLLAAGDPTSGSSMLGLRVEPNPFRSLVQIHVPGASGDVTILDVGGRVVRRLTSPAALDRVGWDGRDGDGNPVAPGTYFARAVVDGVSRVTRVVRLH